VALRIDGQGQTPAPLIGALLRVPWEAVRERMLAGLHARGFTDLTAAHLNVLQYPGPHKVRPSELAARTRMTKQALNYLLGQMEDSGYLHRRADPDDQRSKRIELTDRGHHAVRAIREIVIEVEAEWERDLGGTDFSHLRRLLTRLNSTVTPPRLPAGTGD
jgi:DNA-binding MarR family transcriptional regulator